MQTETQMLGVNMPLRGKKSVSKERLKYLLLFSLKYSEFTEIFCTYSPPAPIHRLSAFPLTKKLFNPLHLNFCRKERTVA